MSSKLLHAIVGVGLSLGGAQACFAQVEDDDGAAPNGAAGNDGTSNSGGSGAMTVGAGGSLNAADAGEPDAEATDGGIVDWDAFCDKPWPITKANTAAPPTCADRIACANAVEVPVCLRQIGPHHCANDYVSVICQSGEWACPAGTLWREECWCWGDIAPGTVCTEAGPMPVDAGGG